MANKDNVYELEIKIENLTDQLSWVEKIDRILKNNAKSHGGNLTVNKTVDEALSKNRKIRSAFYSGKNYEQIEKIIDQERKDLTTKLEEQKKILQEIVEAIKTETKQIIQERKNENKSDIREIREADKTSTINKTSTIKRIPSQPTETKTSSISQQASKDRLIKTTPVLVSLDEGTHTYIELKKDGTPKKKSRNFVSVTEIAGAITKQSDLSGFMNKGETALKQGIPLQSVYTEDEIKRFNNTKDAAKRGTTIHKAIELLEKGIISDISELKDAINKLANEAVEAGEINPYLNLENKKSYEQVSSVVNKYMDMKKQMGLGNLVTAEIPLGATFELEDGKKINIGGTLDALLTGGTLMDYKATSELDREKITIQENLLRLLLQANKQKLSTEYGLDSEELASQMLVAHIPPNNINNAYLGKIKPVDSDVITQWLQAFLKGDKIEIQQQVTPLASFKDYDIGGNEGEAIAIGGKFLGNWANEYLRWNKIANAENDSNMRVMSEDERNALYDRMNLSYSDRKNYSQNYFVTPEEIEKARKSMSLFFQDFISAFNEATDEQKLALAKKLYGATSSGGNITFDELDLKQQFFEDEKYPFYSALRDYLEKNAPEIEKTWEDYYNEEPWKEEEQVSDFLYEDAKTEEEKRKQLRERQKYIKGRLSSETTSMLDEYSGEKIIQEANLLEDLQKRIDAFALEIEKGTSQEELAEIAKSITGSIRNLYKNLSDPSMLSNLLERYPSEVRSWFSTEKLGTEGVASIGANKTLRLIEAANTIEKSMAKMADDYGITYDMAKGLSLSSLPGKQAEYDLSKRVKDIFFKDGTLVKDLDKAFQELFTIDDKEVRGIQQIWDNGDKEAIKKQIIENYQNGQNRKENFQEQYLINSAYGQSILRPYYFDSQIKSWNIENMIGYAQDQVEKSKNLRGVEEAVRKGLVTTWERVVNQLYAELYAISSNPPQPKNQHTSNVKLATVFYDTETTGNNPNSDLPVTFGAVSKDKKYYKYLDYGTDEKNLRNMIQAMSISNETGDLIESSKELRKEFGIGEDINLKDNISEDLKKKILDKINSNKVTPEELFKDIEQMLDGGILAGFNSNKFDYSVLNNWLSSFGRTIELTDQFESLFNPSNTQDYMVEAVKQFGGKFNQGQYTGKLNLQSLRKLFLGEEDSGAHGALSDAETLQSISNLLSDGRLAMLGNISRDIAQEMKIPQSTAKGSDFRKIVGKVFDVASTGNFGIADYDTIKQLVKESDEIKSLNQVAEDHVKAVDKMTAAEQGKIIVSEKLVDALKEEEKQIKDTTKVSQEKEAAADENLSAEQIIIQDQQKKQKQAEAEKQAKKDINDRKAEKERLLQQAKENKKDKKIEEEKKEEERGFTEAPKSSGSRPLKSPGIKTGDNYLDLLRSWDATEVLKDISTFYEEDNAIIDNTKQALNQYNKEVNNQVKALGQVYEIQSKIKLLEEKINEVTSSGNEDQIASLNQELTLLKQKQNIAEEEYKSATIARQQTGIDQGMESNYLNREMQAQVKQINLNATNEINRLMRNTDTQKEYKKEIEGIANQEKLVKQYISYYKEQLKLEREIEKVRLSMQGQEGEDLKNSQNLLNALSQQRQILQSNAIIYDEQRGELNGIVLTDANRLQLQQQINKLNAQQETQLIKINNSQKEQVSLIDAIVGGLRASFRNLTDYTIAYEIIGQIRGVFNSILSATKQLNSNLVDIQIASGMTAEQVHQTLIDYSDIAYELGKTTSDVAIAANDWLRAGYEGQEAAELTKASMELAALGMIDSADATTYLISTLKGWKLAVEDVEGVVDKLTVTKCGVCLVISIGHGLKCR